MVFEFEVTRTVSTCRYVKIRAASEEEAERILNERIKDGFADDAMTSPAWEEIDDLTTYDGPLAK